MSNFLMNKFNKISELRSVRIFYLVILKIIYFIIMIGLYSLIKKFNLLTTLIIKMGLKSIQMIY
jgi:hypothetical protein